MFTGLIIAQGEVAEISPGGAGARMRIDADLPGVLREGDSIAVDGACLTATTADKRGFCADLSEETMAVCVPWRTGGAVNLELPMAADGRFGGHFVTGHVEGRAAVEQGAGNAGPEDDQGGREMAFRVPSRLARFIVAKGSIALAGVSLTVNDIQGEKFSVRVIPHTLAFTNLGRLQAGAEANIETDILARHAAKLLQA